MHRGEFLLVYKLFYLKGQKKTGFYIGIVLYPHKNVLLGNRSEKDNLEGVRKRKKVHHLDTTRARANKWRGSKWDCSKKIK